MGTYSQSIIVKSFVYYVVLVFSTSIFIDLNIVSVVVPLLIIVFISTVCFAGADDQSRPLGQKCLICKRDLSFTPEGPVLQPVAPPHVAVLPCGHTFHDHCLSIITPHDQPKDPPCIPCALGET